MLLSLIQKIQKAEEKAKKIVSLAKEDAIKTEENSKEECASVLENAKNSSRREREQIIGDAVTSASGEAHAISAKAQAKLSSMEALFLKNEDEAINWVIERVVL